MMPEQQISVGPPRQVRVAGVNVGALRVKPDAEDPEAVVGVFNPDLGEPEMRRVRPGDRFTVAGREFHVTGIAPPPGASVDMTVTWPEGRE